MITEQDLLNTREQIQEDIDCVLDGENVDMVNACCQVIIDRFADLILKANSFCFINCSGGCPCCSHANKDDTIKAGDEHTYECYKAYIEYHKIHKDNKGNKCRCS